jgi:hypothetical protein
MLFKETPRIQKCLDKFASVPVRSLDRDAEYNTQLCLLCYCRTLFILGGVPCNSMFVVMAVFTSV